MSPTSFGKRDRDRAKKAKADAKRARRQSGAAAGSDTEPDDAEQQSTTSAEAPSNEELLQMIEEVHRLRELGRITDDDFHTTKSELLGRLSVD